MKGSRSPIKVFLRPWGQSHRTLDILRPILADEIGTKPDRIHFKRNKMGKPLLASPRIGLKFNASHSGSLIAIVTSRSFCVGCDIEKIKPRQNILGIAERFFRPHEVAKIKKARSPRARVVSFLGYWTRKEACLKSLGLGVFKDLHRLEILSSTKARIKMSRGWKYLKITRLRLPRGYMGCYASST